MSSLAAAYFSELHLSTLQLISKTQEKAVEQILTPMDYYAWDAVEKDTNCCASTTKSQLIDRIKAVFETLPRESVTLASSRIRGWIEAAVTANGDSFE